MSSETSPLLAQPDGPANLPAPNGAVEEDRVPIFLRAAHSPWPWLKQRVLCYIRGLVLLVLTLAGATGLNYKLKDRTHHEGEKDEYNHSPLRILFQFSTITLFLLTVYHSLVFAWTLMHYRWPNGGEGYSGIKAKVLNAAAPPEQRSNSPKRFLFSLLYTSSHTAAFLNSLIYWAILVPRRHDDGDKGKKPEGLSFGGGDKSGGDKDGKKGDDGKVIVVDDTLVRSIALFCIFVLPTVVALIETLFLNSIKKPTPVPSHILAVMLLAAAYLGWAYIGMVVTGHGPFYFFDPAKMGSKEAVATACAGFVGLGPGLFSVMYGLIVLREWLVKKLGY